jgi:type IV pilus biogenesis protein PilP
MHNLFIKFNNFWQIYKSVLQRRLVFYLLAGYLALIILMVYFFSQPQPGTLRVVNINLERLQKQQQKQKAQGREVKGITIKPDLFYKQKAPVVTHRTGPIITPDKKTPPFTAKFRVEGITAVRGQYKAYIKNEKGQTAIAKVGNTLWNKYRVVSISAKTVVLSDQYGQTKTLYLGKWK